MYNLKTKLSEILIKDINMGSGKICILCFSENATTSCISTSPDEKDGLTNIYKLIERTKGTAFRKQRQKNGPKVEKLEETGLPTNLDDDDVTESEECPCLEDVLKNLEKESFSVCPNCNKITANALDSRIRAEELEKTVRLLQHQLLEILRKLQQEVEFFNQEMVKIETSIKQPDKDGFNERSKLQGVTLVQDTILEVVTDFRFFQSDLNDKLVVSCMEEDVTETEQKVEVFEQPIPEIFIPEAAEELELEIVTFNTSVIDESEPMMEESVGLQFDCPLYYGSHYILGGDEGVEEIDATNGGESSSEGNHVNSLHETFTYEDKHVVIEHGSTPTTPPKERAKPKQNSNTSKFKGINLSRMSTFKRVLIKRAMERETKRKFDDDFHENPLIKYYLRYDPVADSFFVGNVQVRLNENAKKDKLKCMGFGCDASWLPPTNYEHASTFDRDIRNHVIGKHLGGFSCRVCNLVLNSYFKLITHFKKQHPGQKPLNSKSSVNPRRSSHKKVTSATAHEQTSSKLNDLSRFSRKTPRQPHKKTQRLL